MKTNFDRERFKIDRNTKTENRKRFEERDSEEGFKSSGERDGNTEEPRSEDRKVCSSIVKAASRGFVRIEQIIEFLFNFLCFARLSLIDWDCHKNQQRGEKLKIFI